MANIKSSKISSRKSEIKRRFNSSRRSKIKTFIKKVHVEISSGSKDSARLAFCTVQSILDRYATKGLIHKNKAARHKSRLENKIKKLN
ncbi:30S ribosomal protein S20 [Buchnera aphidicola (Schlechtendalia chinensis)]|uniref:Small ribosomal subunit protein bS20 n=1 Tax=Buchnera aphidicola subsp. Schlechtendalia chinensis TaxID=118110 RepID=A0A172WDB0_BUCSC|nr:30S ribosomal protein S20 [Buchnera aphidicola]ANF16948.1 30S ribosomal protein S20 [Buchnera aphidicola (Schlechtendalia chinensis)]